MEEKKQKAKRGLGRGLGALFDTEFTEDDVSISNYDETGEKVTLIKLRDIEPNKNQPRKNFVKVKLETLSESLKTHGVIQPILVKKGGSVYTVIAGERRWRAAKLAGIKEVPCIVKDFDEKTLAEVALIENLQREDLNPIEEAEGFLNLMNAFGMRQDDVAKRVGRSRSAVANALRLNKLPDKAKKLVISGELSGGHARTILPIENEADLLFLAEKIVKENLTVRETETIVSLYLKNGKFDKDKKKKSISPSAKKYYKEIEKTLSDKFGTKVKIHTGKNKNKIEFEYYSDEDLERLLFELK